MGWLVSHKIYPISCIYKIASLLCKNANITANLINNLYRNLSYKKRGSYYDLYIAGNLKLVFTNKAKLCP